MEEKKGPVNTGEKQFIRETIEQPQASGSRLWRRVFLALGLGAVFGLSASLTFMLSGRALRKMIPGQQTSLETVLISRDSQGVGETEEPDETLEEGLTRDPSMIAKGKELAAKLEKSMVEVTSLLIQEDVFERVYTHSQKSFGVILAITGEDVRILTDSEPLEDADAVNVTFFNGASGEAQQLGLDQTTGIAVISMPLSEIDPARLAELEPAELGNSYQAQPGDMVLALGEPLGSFPSIGMGIISKIEENVQGMDMNFEILHSDIAGSEDACGLLVDVDAKVIGWIGVEAVQLPSTHISAYTISDLKGLIGKLTNGEQICRLGVKVQTVTEKVAEEQHMPQGLFVTEVLSDSPALAGGIRNGDILVRFGEKDIRTVQDLQDVLAAADPDDRVNVTVMRSSRREYTEQILEVVVEER